MHGPTSKKSKQCIWMIFVYLKSAILEYNSTYMGAKSLDDFVNNSQSHVIYKSI